MKKKMKKSIVSTLSVAMLSMSAVGIASANEIIPISAPLTQYIPTDATHMEIVEGPMFVSITGVIQEISTYGTAEDLQLVTVKSADDQINRFVISESTYVMDELTVGKEIISFYDANTPVIMIYPPQYSAVAVAAVDGENTVKVDRFDKDLLSAEGNLKLILSDETKIIAQDGSDFTGELTDRTLVVTYSILMESFPAQTNPSQIVVLDKKDGEIEVKEQFSNVKGTITAINRHGADDRMQLIEIDLGEDVTAHVVRAADTFVADELAVGDHIVAFYDATAMMIAIYPPRYKAEAIALVNEEREVMVDFFDENLRNAANTLVLNIGGETKIEDQNGDDFKGSLANQKLYVEYTFTTKSLPAQTTPSRVVVLNDVAVAPIAEKTFTVNGATIEAPAAFETEDGTVMVPLRALAEALGHEVGWDDATMGITIGHFMSLQIGQDAYVFAKKAPMELGTAPQLVDIHTYVPLNFFTEVAQLSEAKVTNDQIVINK